jgi:hypothetical protein
LVSSILALLCSLCFVDFFARYAALIEDESKESTFPEVFTFAARHLSLDVFQSWLKQPGFSDSWYHLTIWFRVGDYPVEYHL